MEMCSRCGVNPAMVFIMRQDPTGVKNEGLCIPCAKELGINLPKQVQEAEEFIENFGENIQGLVEIDEDDDGQGKAPMIDFNKLGQMFFGGAKGDGSAPKDGEKGKEKKKKEPDGPKKATEQYCISLTDKARAGKLDRVIGRVRELERLMQILTRRQKNNPCLIGEPGVGKTAIAEALAQRIVKGEVPYKLKNKEVLLVDMTALVAGTQFRGQFEGRMKALINEVKAQGNIILVIDEVHSIVGAGDAEGSMNAANILKPALSRGEIQLIGATTLAEYRKYIEKDSALERRFQPIIVEENSISDTVEILKGIKHYYEAYHRINVPNAILEKAVTFAERYITDRFLPDKAIDLLDEACSRLALNSTVIDELSACEDILPRLKSEEKELSEKVLNESDEEKRNATYKRIAELKGEIMRVTGEIDRLAGEVRALTLTEEMLAQVIEIWTGIPASSITEKEFERLARLDEELKKHVVGQDVAINAITRAIKRSRVGVSAKRKPISFIFAGPTGVGKTELVKRLAMELFDAPESLIRLDMSEFMEKHAVSRIIGAPPGYIGYDDAGQLTEKIRRKPYSVVLFDEIEKAHPDVMNVLLQILDDGRITDAQGRTVNFENTVIVMTTNAGSKGDGALGFGASTQVQNEEKTKKALGEFLRPEFINRVDEIITFKALTVEDFEKIAVIMLDELKAALEYKGYKVKYDEKAVKTVAHGSFSEKFGARNMRRYIQTNIEDVIAEKIIEMRASVALVSISANKDCNEIKITVA